MGRSEAVHDWHGYVYINGFRQSQNQNKRRSTPYPSGHSQMVSLSCDRSQGLLDHSLLFCTRTSAFVRV